MMSAATAFVADPLQAHAAGDVAGRVVVLDPGHSGLYDSSMTSQVPTGRGGTKDCQTSGTATNDGYPEHAFNWAVITDIQRLLNAEGVRTVLSRPDDASLGPCVNQRASAANAQQPDAIVSIHADGGPQSGHGFHVNYSAPPLNDTQAVASVRLATTMRDTLVSNGLQPSTYIGSGGLFGRSDLAGLNLAQYPAVLIELGNMRNDDDAAAMESTDGRARYATAVASGIETYLATLP
ncbi:Rv3717 family N-acetylmuramoyl-L-alanine amidase [Mycobacterium sp. BK086]|uniref:Rv3717 family N-acetylmuramoyl-L-alanine amidase n=1 Tax=Mycobacterium sp. BK086 TaxID=2512165 RepID=UPI0025709BA6|nr:Rv3717 family N-acetylmuramoyl-L-alanine amidase [Mycobacterium sp. BK086]